MVNNTTWLGDQFRNITLQDISSLKFQEILDVLTDENLVNTNNISITMEVEN